MEIPQEFIIVEGRDDTKRLIETFGPQVKTIETNGSALSRKVQTQIIAAAQQFGIIVFTDPDYQGDRVRRLITDLVPSAKHAYLTPDQAKGHKVGQSLGIEHASPEVLKAALSQVVTPQTELADPVPMADLIKLGLIGLPQSDQRRAWLSEAFHLGKVNGKQLQKKLQQYHLSLDQIKAVIDQKEANSK